jgi:hypothetical protein
MHLSNRVRRPAYYRPHVETLEVRCVPSTVTNLLDAGPGTLRQAILDTPPGGTVDFQADLSGTITLTSGELSIAKDLTIAGPGANVITVSGNGASRVFDITGAFAVAITGLTIGDGQVVGVNAAGGGINNAGMLTITACLFMDNAANATGTGSTQAFGAGGPSIKAAA